MAVAFFKGLAFPFIKNAVSLPAAVTDDELVRQSILQILMTKRGERVMRPQFGADLYSFVFDNNDSITEELLRVEISTAITKFESRARIQDIFFTTDDTTLTVTVDFVVLSTNTLNTVAVALPTIGT